MAKIRIESALSPADTKVWLDDRLVQGVVAISFTRTLKGEPTVDITLYADPLIVEGEVGEVTCG